MKNVNQEKLGNNFERAVIGKNDEIPPREMARYEWAKERIIGKKVLEIGCSSGYGTRILPEDIDYTGVDYDKKIVKFANKEFGNRFICADINEFDLDDYDTIIAFEVLEHLENGKELAQKLKGHCKRLICSVPFLEDKGFWGEHHLLHGLSKKDFPGFGYEFMNINGEIGKQEPNGLMLMEWKKGHITAMISSKDRYFSTLPMAIQSIATQTRKPDHFILFDDGEGIDLRKEPIYKNLFKLLERNGISWEVLYGEKSGQHYNHQKCNEIAQDLIWRLDDDNVAESNVLEELENKLIEGVGAVGGSVIEEYYERPINISSKIEDISWSHNIQWFVGYEVEEVDHLYSSFLYRKGITDYDLSLSTVAHREETMFSHDIKKAGYKLIYTPVITWHLKNEKGGIRSFDKRELWEHDEEIFRKWLKKNNIETKKLIVLDNGLGDHIVFEKVLKKIKEDIVLAVCYPEVFDINVISIIEANADLDKHNVYKFMADNDWNKTLKEAFEEMYGITSS